MSRAQVLEVTGNAYAVPVMGAIFARLSVVLAPAMERECAMPGCILERLCPAHVTEVQLLKLMRERIVRLSRELCAAQQASAKSELSRRQLQSEEVRLRSRAGEVMRQSQVGGTSGGKQRRCV